MNTRQIMSKEGKHIFILGIILCIFISGCLTAASFIKTVEQNPNLTVQEADKKFGFPIRTDTLSYEKNITYRVYVPYGASLPSDNIAVYFLNNKVARYGRDDVFFHLSMLRDFDLINQTEYNQRRDQIVKEQERQREIALQALPTIMMMQNMQYQNALNAARNIDNRIEQQHYKEQYEQLQRKQQVDDITNRSIQNSREIMRQNTPSTIHTDCSTDNYGNVHCTSKESAF